MLKKAVANEAAETEKNQKVQKEIVVLREEHKKLNEQHSDLFDRYLAGITGEIAKELKDGEACPVCGSKNQP